MDVRNLTDYQKDQLLNFFAYSMGQDTRARLMAELPRAYNAWCDQRVVKVTCIPWMERGENGDVIVPLDQCEAQKQQKQ